MRVENNKLYISQKEVEIITSLAQMYNSDDIEQQKLANTLKSELFSSNFKFYKYESYGPDLDLISVFDTNTLSYYYNDTDWIICD